jgi:membrane-bound ClpP family serine protease
MGNRKNLPQHGKPNPALNLMLSDFTEKKLRRRRARRLPVKSGTATMVGKVIPAVTPISSQGGKVFVEGEYWNAVSKEPVPEGASVKILAVRGLMLDVTLNNQ